jgi:Pyruvate/2-oxoacid:ferredoxin oxidoreductase delta subunit
MLVRPTRRCTSCVATVFSFLCYASKPLPSPTIPVSYILGQPADRRSVLYVVWRSRKPTVKVSNRVRCVILWVDTPCSETLDRRRQASRCRRNLKIPGRVCTGQKICVSHASTAFVRKNFPSDEYLRSYA